MVEPFIGAKFISATSDCANSDKIYLTRPTSALIYRESGISEYSANGITLRHEQGNCIFLPRGISFRVRRIIDGSYIAVNFDTEFPAGEIRIIYTKRNSSLSGLFRQILRSTISHDTLAQCNSIRDFYAILAEIEKCNVAYLPSATAKLTECAVKYMMENIYLPELSISHMIALSKISDTYFRHVFQAMFGTTPSKYIRRERVNHACDIFRSGEYRNIGEVAMRCGYDDFFYFSRVFKIETGSSPREYITKIKTGLLNI